MATNEIINGRGSSIGAPLRSNQKRRRDKSLAKDWTLDKDEHQSEVLDRVIAFATVAKKLASIDGTAGRPNRARSLAIIAAAPTRFKALSGNLKETADQMAQLKAQHDASQRTVALLTSERDALSRL